MAKQKENAVVHSQEQLADGIYSMWINTEAAKDAKPGQFISMYTTDGSKLLPRPISICEIDKENGRLRVVYRVTGPYLACSARLPSGLSFCSIANALSGLFCISFSASLRRGVCSLL